ncbi:MAG: hypothetical protein RLZZ129_564 [Verrucomicrobiota bacterium]|jgi:hypothetical protein
MSIRFRFALLFGCLLLGFASAMLLQQWLEQRERIAPDLGYRPSKAGCWIIG